MEALWILIFKNKEFGVLAIIAVFQIKQYYQSQGRFDLHEERIANTKEIAIEAKKESGEAKDEAKKAFKCVGKINKKVDQMHKMLEDKYKRQGA